MKTTGPFSASVRPLQKKIQDNAVILSWSAPRTIDLKNQLKVNFVCVKFFLAVRGKCNFMYLPAYTYMSPRQRVHINVIEGYGILSPSLRWWLTCVGDKGNGLNQQYQYLD